MKKTYREKQLEKHYTIKFNDISYKIKDDRIKDGILYLYSYFKIDVALNVINTIIIDDVTYYGVFRGGSLDYDKGIYITEIKLNNSFD